METFSIKWKAVNVDRRGRFNEGKKMEKHLYENFFPFKDTPEMFRNYFYIEFVFDLFSFKFYAKGNGAS